MRAIRGSLLLATLLSVAVLRAAEGQERRNWVLGQPVQPDSFYMNPENQVVDRGSRITLECVPRNLSNTAGVVWAYINDEGKFYNILTNDTELGYYLIPHDETIRNWKDLVIPSVTDYHETGYQCLVYATDATSYYSDVAEICIYEQVTLMFPDQFTNVVTTLGGTVSIPIQVHGKPMPTITLQKMMDGSWTSIQATRFRVNDTQISLSSAREADTGEYRLVLSNREHQSITYEFNITVEGQWNAQAVKTAMELRKFPSLQCPGVTCPRILCADPHYNAKHCCPSCDHSQCMFSGCVTLSDSQAGNQWQPDPCTTCYCVNGKQLCDKQICPPLDCPAELTVTKPGVCCPYCNYVKIKKGCKVKADKTVNITIKYSDGDEDDELADKEAAPGDREKKESDCVIQVKKHRCATKWLKKYGKVYRCLPRYQKRHVNVNRQCHLNRAKIAYTDITHCVGHVQAMWRGGSSIPEPHCDLFVPSRDRSTS